MRKPMSGTSFPLVLNQSGSSSRIFEYEREEERSIILVESKIKAVGAKDSNSPH